MTVDALFAVSDWYEEYFGEEYLLLYPHRDEEDAERLVAALTRVAPLAPGARVLDVACGTGRHAAAFRARGARVTGVDLSRQLLRRARQDARIPVIRCDVRRIPVRPGSMDLTVNLFTSFGYFESDAEHLRALREMVATVRPGGRFALDFLNAARVPRDLVRLEHGTLAGRPVQIDRWLDPAERHVFKSITTGDGRRFVERVRLFAARELERLLVEAGGSVRHRLGDYDGGPLAPDSPRVILVALVA
ncbi:MAG TPA: class I SAM-dependent methyltransferase [Gemmatimonadales bacterium]|nr:class I SAM-dependent methyltransferase [Gemmatimonadales bacterium]